MPYDGDIQKFTETQPDVYSLEGFASWLEKQPGEAVYDDSSISDCLICCHGKEQGIQTHSGGICFARAIKPWSERGLYDQINHITYTKPLTYAAALTRARELLVEHGDEAAVS